MNKEEAEQQFNGILRSMSTQIFQEGFNVGWRRDANVVTEGSGDSAIAAIKAAHAACVAEERTAVLAEVAGRVAKTTMPIAMLEALAKLGADPVWRGVEVNYCPATGTFTYLKIIYLQACYPDISREEAIALLERQQA